MDPHPSSCARGSIQLPVVLGWRVSAACLLGLSLEPFSSAGVMKYEEALCVCVCVCVCVHVHMSKRGLVAVVM